MTAITDIGLGSACMIDGIDQSELLNKLQVEMPQTAPETTRFDPNNLNHGARTYIGGLFTGALQTSGLVGYTLAQVSTYIAQSLSRAPGGQDVLVGAGGFIPGNLAFAIKSILTKQTGPTIMPDGPVALAVDFQATAGSPSIAVGKSVWNYHGTDTIAQDTKFTITLTGATGNGTVTFYDNTGTSVGSITVHPGDSTATIKAAIEALPYYNTVAVTGSSSAITTSNIATGGTASATASTGGHTPDKAFDGDAATYWESGISSFPQYLQYDLGSGNAASIAGYSLNCLDISTHGNGLAAAWVLKGSNTGVFGGEEVTIDTKSGQTLADDVVAPYTVAATAAYRYYRIIFSASAGENTLIAVREMTLVHSTTGNGTYTIDVQDPADVNLTKPTTATSGYSTAKTISGEDITGVHKVSATASGAAVRDVAVDVTTSNGALGIVSLGALDGAMPSVTIIWEHAPNSAGSPGSWATLGTFNAMTARGIQRLEIAKGTTIYPFHRFRVSAVSGDVAFAGAYFRYSD